MHKVVQLAAVRARAARIATGASAVRGQGRGCAAAARAFLEILDLERFVGGDAGYFRSQLNKATAELQAALPRAARSWGIARKLLNIFLRDTLYTTYLVRAYRLRQIERFLEVPLDSVTAGKIKEIAGRRALPAWPGVRNLQPDLSDKFQLVAATEARRRGLAKVHLDTFWWGQR